MSTVIRVSSTDSPFIFEGDVEELVDTIVNAQEKGRAVELPTEGSGFVRMTLLPSGMIVKVSAST